MTTIEIDGFLSQECEQGRKNFLTNYSDVFAYAKNINRFGMELITKQKVDWDNKHKLVIHQLMIRILENYQGVVLLLERGMLSQTKTQVRAMLEALFTLVAIEKEPELLRCYLDQHEEATKRSLKATMKLKDKHLRATVKKHNLEKQYCDKVKALKGKELKSLRPKAWAQKAKLEDYYNLYYGIYRYIATQLIQTSQLLVITLMNRKQR